MTTQNFKKPLTINRTKTLADYGYAPAPVTKNPAGLRRIAAATWWYLHNRDIPITRDGFLIAVIAHETEKALLLTIYEPCVPSIQVTEIWIPKSAIIFVGEPQP